MATPKLEPDNICPRWCRNYHKFDANGKHTAKSKQACRACCNLDIERHGQDG